jgi:DNA repair photolyase
MNVFGSPYKQLDRKVNTWCNYTKRVDSYGLGCQHNCSYCYAKSLLNFRGLWNSQAPLKSDLFEIKNNLSQLSKGEIVRLGGMTDCFQPMELKERMTYKTILLLNYYKIHYLIVTKSDLVSRDEYLQIYDKNLSHFQISITSTDKETSLKYEKAPIPAKRIESIEKLYKSDFDVSVRLSPFIEQYIDIDVINNINCDKILIEFLKVNHWIKKSFDIDYSDYSFKFGGFQHLQLCKKIDLVNKITGFNQKSVGEYVYDHYKYFRDNVNFNKRDCCNLNYTKPIHYNYEQLKLF